jgi:hypothetical protein
MLGLFIGEIRVNLDEYEGDVAPKALKKRLFEILGPHLGMTGQPKIIGDLAQAYGHPETGMPAKKNPGLLPIIFFCIGIGGLGMWSLSFI